MVDMVQFGDNLMKKPLNRQKSFHFRYLELCRAKNYTPVSEVKAKNNITSILDFFGDKVRIDDWLLITESLYHDQFLQSISIKLRKNLGYVLDNLDTEKKARMLKKQPVIFSKIIFSGLINSISNNVKCNRILNTLNLEGLPLDSRYIMSIAQALSANENLQIISFNRSTLGDGGCEIICNTVKCLLHIETISMSQCNLTVKGANSIADMIKFQKIYRYSEGWKKSLRYRDVNPDTIPGLRSVIISQNNFGDEGTELITEILKEDVWIKEIDFSECGLTDNGAKYILDCLELNKYIIEIRIKNNNDINPQLIKAINEQLGRVDVQEIDNTKKNKVNVPKIRERVKMLEEQIVAEKNLRKQVENLNEQLHSQIMCYERKLTEEQEVREGYTLIKQEELDALIRERDEYRNAAAINLAKSRTFRKISKIRKARSETKYKESVRQPAYNNSRSEHVFSNSQLKNTTTYKNLLSTFVEKNIGDTAASLPQTYRECNESIIEPYELDHDYSNDIPVKDSPNHKNHNKVTNFRGIEEAMKLFAEKKQQNLQEPNNKQLRNIFF